MIISFTGENFEQHWGFIDYQNKTILDIGADYGSTTECFLTYGAKTVYAIEGDENLYNQLTEYSKDKPIIPIKIWINKTEDFVYLFELINGSIDTNNQFQIDCAKIDCEGAEIYLLDVPDYLLKNIKEYAIECHSERILIDIKRKFENIGFEILGTINIAKSINVVHIKSNELLKRDNSDYNIDSKNKFIAVVNNFDILNKALLQSPGIDYTNTIIVDNTKENKPISYRYNRTIDELLKDPYDSNISWLIFCHQDFYIEENLSLRLKNLDKNYIYGPIGIGISQIGTSHTKELFGRILQTNGTYLGKYCNRCDIDNLDAMCLIVHRDTIRDYYLRFDEKFKFHFYVESFCQKAKYKGIGTKTLQIKCQHRSRSLNGSKDTQEYKYSRDLWIKNFGDIRTTTYNPDNPYDNNYNTIVFTGIAIAGIYLAYRYRHNKTKPK